MLQSSARNETGTIAHGGLSRAYHAYVPASCKPEHPALVLIFHGGGGTAQGMEQVCKMDLAADKYGFIAVYPEGFRRHWNDGRSMSGAQAVDDVGFVSALIDELSLRYDIDRKRVYATGLSNGGFFSQHLACRLPDEIRAVASVAATVPVDCQFSGTRPVPIMFILGDQDPLLPYGGGNIRGLFGGSRGEVLPAGESVQFWLRRNGCSGSPETGFSQNLPDGMSFQCQMYGPGGGKNQVVVYTIHGGGHTWPGGLQYLSPVLVGKTCHTLDANELIWKFFQAY